MKPVRSNQHNPHTQNSKLLTQQQVDSNKLFRLRLNPAFDRFQPSSVPQSAKHQSKESRTSSSQRSASQGYQFAADQHRQHPQSTKANSLAASHNPETLQKLLLQQNNLMQQTQKLKSQSSQVTPKVNNYVPRTEQQPSSQTDQAEEQLKNIVCQAPQNQTPQTRLQQLQNELYYSQAINNQQKQYQVYTDELDQQDSTQSHQQPYVHLGPPRKEDQCKKTLILDLDETLVHSSFKPTQKYDILLPVEIDGVVHQIYIVIRPGVNQFLHAMHRHYELVIFTASLSKYADPLMDIIDPQRLCSYRLFREHCTFYNNAYVKDLSKMGRKMQDVIIVDNSPIAYLFQPENAVPILSWYDDVGDMELLRIIPFLERLAYNDDVRKYLPKINKDSQIDYDQVALFLKKQKRDHSQKVDERNHNYKRQSNRYESADTRGKTHVAQVAAHAPPSSSAQKRKKSSRTRKDDDQTDNQPSVRSSVKASSIQDMTQKDKKPKSSSSHHRPASSDRGGRDQSKQSSEALMREIKEKKLLEQFYQTQKFSATPTTKRAQSAKHQSAQRNYSNNFTANQNEDPKKQSYSNFLSNTQKFCQGDDLVSSNSKMMSSKVDSPKRQGQPHQNGLNKSQKFVPSSTQQLSSSYRAGNSNVNHHTHQYKNGHQRKNSNQNQPPNEVNSMLKMSGYSNSSKATEESSYLKRLIQNDQNPHLSQKTAQTPKFKENISILNTAAGHQGLMNNGNYTSKHQKRPSNPFNMVIKKGVNDSENQKQPVQIKLITNNNNTLKQSQTKAGVRGDASLFIQTKLSQSQTPTTHVPQTTHSQLRDYQRLFSSATGDRCK